MKIFIDFLKRYNELWLAPLAILIWLLSPYLFHMVDETAATYDIAVFQKIIFGIIVFNCCTLGVWIALRITFPGIFKYLTEQFDTDFSNLTTTEKCEKLKISLALFACYLLGSLLAMLVL